MAFGDQMAALRAAARVLADALKAVASVRTDETAAAVNIEEAAYYINVNAGHPGGPWGWEPIQALMFDNNLQHPLFGDRRHWYRQGHYPMTDITVALKGNDAAKAYADVRIPQLIDEYL